jgi:hypothetical protein
MFPFPLGKTSAKATIKDELWWEGGNAPHVVSLPFFPLVCKNKEPSLVPFDVDKQETDRLGPLQQTKRTNCLRRTIWDDY